ncbi:hypothetical protein FQA39_LY13803 [Lamprigera yunnana]|nr:hypothetical protein FQA39_LY13803 [Lamprigera yunnana]
MIRLISALNIVGMITAQSFYRAAVVEYATRTNAETFTNIVLENVKEYLFYIEDAANQAVDIIVFPEDGLTEMDIDFNNIDSFSTLVPDPLSNISPCDAPYNATFSKALIDISCAAEAHRIYVVVNLVEKYYDVSEVIYYNTNVVFDRNGVVIVRFRKINLYKEKYVKPGNESIYFTTDFGVTFGIFICNDILFKNPSIDVLNNLEITDVIFSTAWFAELPFHTALSVQHGYAVSNKVNLLAANLDDPDSGKGGSGIYLANGEIADMYISGARTSKMLMATVHKITRSNSNNYCQTLGETLVEKKANLGVLPDVSEFNTLPENLENYTFVDLHLSQKNIFEEACSGSNFCCSINITLKASTKINYAYKLVAFNGGRYIGWDSIGERVCGVVACLNESNVSCGLRHSTAPLGITFERLSLEGIFHDLQRSHIWPSTINFDLHPISKYTFCEEDIGNDKIKATLTAEAQDSLLTFGLIQRVFDNDNKGTGVFNNGGIHLINLNYIVIFSIIRFLM